MKTLHKKGEKTNKTLKKKNTKYFCEQMVEEIMSMYKKMFIEDDEYLEWIDKDLLFFIGIRENLEKVKGIKGIKMWNYLSSKSKKARKPSKLMTRLILMELPLSYLRQFRFGGFAPHDDISRADDLR